MNSNKQKFANGIEVYHFDLFAGWNKVRVISFNAETNEYSLREEDPEFGFDFEDYAELVHATPDNSLLPKFQVTPR